MSHNNAFATLIHLFTTLFQMYSLAVSHIKFAGFKRYLFQTVFVKSKTNLKFSRNNLFLNKTLKSTPNKLKIITAITNITII